jgi:hypothetical protein
MKEHIHTIPVMDALQKAEEQKLCPFCVMREKLERDAIGFIMGPAYMEDDIRMQTNKLGFCAAHLKSMYGEQNRLGLGLMLHTFVQQLNKDINACAKTDKSPLPFFGKKGKGATPAERLKNHLDATQASCYLCRMTDNTFCRYMDTFLSLWRKNGEEAKIIEAVPGYCLPHFAELLAMSDCLGKSKQEAFLGLVIPRQQAYLQQLEDDLEWFTLKFDYRNVNEPWKNAKDALPRAMAVLRQMGEPT